MSFVFLGPALLQVEEDQFEATTTDAVAEGQAHQQYGDRGAVDLNHGACGFVARQMMAAQQLFEEAEEQFDEQVQLVQGGNDFGRHVKHRFVSRTILSELVLSSVVVPEPLFG